MKANELRIGNKVSFEGSIVTVNTIADDEVTFSDYASLDYPQIEDISGIELTEEWLVKFGFKKGCKYSNDGYTFPCGDFFFYDNLFDVLEGCGGRCISVVKSVHSLQNLYFALTGEELKQA